MPILPNLVVNSRCPHLSACPALPPPATATIASSSAADLYGLQVLTDGIQDDDIQRKREMKRGRWGENDEEEGGTENDMWGLCGPYHFLLIYL